MKNFKFDEMIETEHLYYFRVLAYNVKKQKGIDYIEFKMELIQHSHEFVVQIPFTKEGPSDITKHLKESCSFYIESLITRGIKNVK